MNQIAVDGGGHVDAIDGFYGANNAAADDITNLIGSLGGCGAMAGDDSGGLDWAKEYDPAADRVISAACDFVESLATMANLINGNLKNHEGADYGAQLPNYPYAPPDYDGDPDPDHTTSSIGYGGVPSAAGGSGDSPTGWRLIESHLEGFLWPDADTGKLRTAAKAWNACADRMDDHALTVLTCRGSVATQQSPEIALALNACDELESIATELGTAMRELGSACSGYADQVDEHHSEVISALEELVAWSVADQVVGGLLSVVTLGGSEAGAQAVEAGLIARTALKVLGILRRLVELARVWASKILLTAGKAVRLSARLAKFVKAERVAARLEKAGVLITLQGRKLTGVIDIPVVQDAKLRNYVKDFYKGSQQADRTGDGTTADAIRKELATGELVKGKGHTIKGQGLINGLTKWLRNNPGAPADEVKVAQDMLDDLVAAMAGH